MRIPAFLSHRFVCPYEPPLIETFKGQKNYCLHLQGRRIALVHEDGTTAFNRNFFYTRYKPGKKMKRFARGSYVETDNIFGNTDCEGNV